MLNNIVGIIGWIFLGLGVSSIDNGSLFVSTLLAITGCLLLTIYSKIYNRN